MPTVTDNSLTRRSKQHAILVGILLLAAVLRCYDLFSIPYTHDELSGLIRTRFDSFGELIAKGVAVDGHPALVQVFLYYWTQLFGTDEWIVKLPFILTGIGAVYLSCRIGTRWANVTTGLLVAAIVATSQYPLMYSQIARPYTSGFFLVLLVAYHWGELVFFRNYARRHLVLFPVAAALCAYNHHFSMFTAGLIGLAGLVFVGRAFFWRYVLLCLAAVVLYAPHFPILAAQMKMKGLDGWLGVPDLSFFPHYVHYLFQYSTVVLIACGCVVVWTRIAGTQKRQSTRAILFSAALFLAVALTGYVYSVTVAPVLQSSVLLFVYPFLLFAVFGWAKEQSPRANLLLVLVIVLLNGYALIVDREHYRVFYKTPFEQLIVDANEATKQHPRTLVLVFSDEPKTRFYQEKGRVGIPASYRFINDPAFTEKHLDSLLHAGERAFDYVCLASTSALPPNFRAMVLQKYPHVLWQRNYFSAETLLAGKGRSSGQTIADFLHHRSLFTGVDPQKWRDGAYHIAEGEEWAPGFSRPVAELVRTPSDIVDVIAKVKLSDLAQDPLLVVTVQTQDSVFGYFGNAVSQKYIDRDDSTVTLVQSVRFSDSPYQRFDGPFLGTYIWNRDRKPLRLLSFTVVRRKGNPYLYGLFEEIP